MDSNERRSAVEKTWQLYINGRWVGAQSGQTFAVVNPATQDVLAQVPDGGPAEAHAAVEAAAGAFPGWARLPGIERGRLLTKTHQLMLERCDDLARLVTQENGKPLDEARKEVTFAAGYFSWFAEEARRMYGAIVPTPSPQHRLWVLKQPLGVVAAITPWNFPATMVTRKIAPALAAGCPVVLKPASATPLTALALAEILHEAGLPAGVVNVVVGKHSSPLAEVFIRHPQVRKIAFTGSTEVGKALMAQAAQQLKRVAFELGGNAPFVVFEDADLREAIEGAAAIKFMRVAGQSCICANRIYVQESMAAHFIPAFIDRVRTIKVGDGFQPGVEVGPLINEATLHKVESLVQDAVAKGAQVAIGGERLHTEALSKGWFYTPTVLLEVRDEMPVCQEEIFGPVAPVLTFRTEAELIARANATPFGLASYVYTQDYARILRLAEALEYGLVGVNDATGYTHEIPFGGFKESGLGREGGHEGLEEYLESKSIVLHMPQS
jgi:succinate-semialdehyde dehydrogenase / glutarate-semialdehyde dehydrogenase